MSYETILEKVISVFSAYTDVEEVTEDCEVMSDLEISSMEILTLICNMEAEFDIQIPERSIRKMVTIGDVASIIAELKN